MNQTLSRKEFLSVASVAPLCLSSLPAMARPVSTTAQLAEQLRPRINDAFTMIDEAGQPHAIILTEVEAQEKQLDAFSPKTQQLSLRFKTQQNISLEDGLYQISHPKAGRYEWFATVTPAENTTTIEVILNHFA